MVSKIKGLNLLDLILALQLVAGFGMLYLKQSFIFFIYAAFAMLSRIVFGFFEANLHEAKLFEISKKKFLAFLPLFVLLSGFFGWIMRELLRFLGLSNAQSVSAVDEFFLKSPYLLIALVLLIAITAIAAGGILRGYRQK